MTILPQELINEILCLVPVESLVRFQCVSKPWFSLITGPYFMKMHFHTNSERSLIGKNCNSMANHWPEEYYLVNFSNEDRFGEPVKIFTPFYHPEYLNHTSMIGSCNGLVCIHNHECLFCSRNSGYEIVIWNPSIRKYKKLPFEPVDPVKSVFGYDSMLLNLAFGYDPVNDDYRVLRIVKFRNMESERGPEVKVYSLKAHSWRRVEDQWPYKEPVISSAWPVFTNCAFHWLVASPTGANTLLAFDLITEKFRVQTFPFQSHSIRGLEVLGESLCVSAYTEARDIEVWMMKEYSWSRLCTVPMTFHYRRSLVFSKDGEKVLMENNFNKFFWYDVKRKTPTINVEHISNKRWTVTCVGSLLLLDGDGDSDN